MTAQKSTLFIEVIVAYDIADNKARRKLHDGLLNLGLYDIQKSVFWGRLNQAERKAITRLFSQLLQKDDRALILPAQMYKAVTAGDCFGYQEDSFVEKRSEII
ncbi:MAG: CRISPR-associated endonuclease Cas2 [Leptospiraceae bacterium]|nr:CRISPR-associated endonuclease Cas2 [Leptospiraceae bacterium]